MSPRATNVKAHPSQDRSLKISKAPTLYHSPPLMLTAPHQSCLASFRSEVRPFLETLGSSSHLQPSICMRIDGYLPMSATCNNVTCAGSRVGALCRRLKNLLSATSLWTTLHKNFSFAKPHTALTNARLQHAKSYEAAKSTKSALQAGLAFPHSVGLRTQTGLAWKYPTQIGKPLTQSQPSLTQSKIGVTQPSSTGLGLGELLGTP